MTDADPSSDLYKSDNVKRFVRDLAYKLRSGDSEANYAGRLEEALFSSDLMGLVALYRELNPSHPIVEGRILYRAICTFFDTILLTSHRKNREYFGMPIVIQIVNNARIWRKDSLIRKAEFIRSEFHIPTQFEIVNVTTRACNDVEGYRGTLFTHNSLVKNIKVVSRQGAILRTPVLLDPRIHLPCGILDDVTKNYALIDEQDQIIAVVWRGMFGSIINEQIKRTCQECFRLRRLGKRGESRQGPGKWVGLGYTTSYAENMHATIMPYKNFKTTASSQDAKEHDSDCTAMCSVIWNAVHKTLENQRQKDHRFGDFLDRFRTPFQENQLPKLGQGSDKTNTCQLGGFDFQQDYAEAISAFVGYCASAPVHHDNDLTPTIFHMPERAGPSWKDGGGVWFDFLHGVGIPLESNTTILFRAEFLHGTTIMDEGVKTYGIALATTSLTVNAFKRYIDRFGKYEGWNN